MLRKDGERTAEILGIFQENLVRLGGAGASAPGDDAQVVVGGPQTALIEPHQRVTEAQVTHLDVLVEHPFQYRL